MINSHYWVFLLGLFISACDHKLVIRPEQIQTRAPTNQAQVGWVVNNLRQEQIAKLVSKYPESQIRVVNASHHIYEIYGLTQDQIIAVTRKENVYHNIFFQSQNLRDKTTSDIAIKHFEKLATRISDLAPQPSDCKNNQTTPFAKILVMSANQTDTVELGTTIDFKAKELVENRTLRHAWAIESPKNSRQENTITTGKNLKFTPDALGLITVSLLSQDENNFCTLESKTFSVTKNENYILPSKIQEGASKSTDLSLFHHLKELKAKEAWQISRGQGQLIAIIDSGVNYNHPDLSSNLFINENEIPNNQIDDDDNGFVDDYLGYDFVNTDPFPFDDEGHGSHVTGLAAASTFGIANESKYLAVKAMSPFGGDLASIVGAIYYSVDAGANIINLSFGTYDEAHPLLIEAVEYAESKNVLLTVAAGNGDPFFSLPVNTDLTPNYPSSLQNQNIISVAARSSHSLLLAPYSNYGANSVTVIAPGGDSELPLFSSYAKNPAEILIQGLYGTSMASPLVAGIAALVWSQQPHLTLSEVKMILTQSGAYNPDLQEYSQSSRYIDALSPLLIKKTILLSGFPVSN